MDSHYHCMVETPDSNLSIGMPQLNDVYTQKYNRRHRKHGNLFQRRVKAILVQKEICRLELRRYVILNSVGAGWQVSWGRVSLFTSRPDFLGLTHR